MITGIGHVEMTVRDIAACSEVYGKELGFEELARGEGADGGQIAMFVCGTSVLELRENPDAVNGFLPSGEKKGPHGRAGLGRPFRFLCGGQRRGVRGVEGCPSQQNAGHQGRAGRAARRPCLHAEVAAGVRRPQRLRRPDSRRARSPRTPQRPSRRKNRAGGGGRGSRSAARVRPPAHRMHRRRAEQAGLRPAARSRRR